MVAFLSFYSHWLLHVWVSLVFFAQRTTAMEKLPCIWDMSWYWTGMDEIISAVTKTLAVFLLPSYMEMTSEPSKGSLWSSQFKSLRVGLFKFFGNESPQLLRTPQPVTVTRRILTFLVRNPFKPLLATVNRWTFSIGWWFSLTVLRFLLPPPYEFPFQNRVQFWLNFFWHLLVTLLTIAK